MSNHAHCPGRRQILALGAAAVGGAATPSRRASAQADNVRKLVVGFAAGGPADRLGRIVAEALSQASPAGFVVDNRPGASGMLATEHVARAEGDGRVLLMHNIDVLAMERALRADPGFDPLRRLTVVAPVARFEYFLAANASLGLRSLQDLVAFGRNSTTSIFYVDAGPGVRIIFESLKKRFGLNLVGVPYRGLAPAMADLLAGRVELAMLDGATAPAQASAGKVTILGRADALSSRGSSRAPTLIEQGADGLWVDMRYALIAPSSTAPQTIDYLRALMAGAMKKPQFRAQLEQAAFHPIDETPEQFMRSAAESLLHYRRLVQQAGMI